MIVFYSPRDRVTGFEPINFTSESVVREWINRQSHPERWRIAEKHIWSNIEEYNDYIQGKVAKYK